MASLTLNPSVTSVNWRITGLSNPFNTDYYQYAYITINGKKSSYVYASAGSTSTSTGSGTFSGLTGDTGYNAYAYVVTKSGASYASGSGYFKTQEPPDTTPPRVPSLSLSERGTTWIKVRASSSDSGSGLNGFTFRLNGGSRSAVEYQSGGSAECTFTGLNEDTSYTVDARAFDNKLNYSNYSSPITVKTLLSRPSNYYFSDYVSVGNGTTQLTANSWNNFTSKIDEFRKWKGLSSYGFLTAYAGNAITATHVNQARTAISAMSPSVSVPSQISSGDICKASMFHQLESSLNSL